jgi:outer membrane immunogenic protein
MKRLCLALIGLMALAGTAAAADLSRPAPAPYYKAPPAFVPYNWTGFYVGINGGGAIGSSSWNSNGSRDISGGLVGGTVGYNYQMGWAVLGAEGDIDWSGIKGTTNNACAPGCQTSNTWLSTVRGRLGYAADRFMPYITGGAAFGSIKASEPGFAGNSTTNAGWTLGAGLEFAVAGNWTAKAEYLYVDLGNFNCGTACGPGAAINNVSFHTSVLRGGVNYRF